MKIQCEKLDGTYEMVDYPNYQYVCGEDFCDDCGDCLACYDHGATDYCNGIGLVFYNDNPKNKLLSTPR